MDARESEQQRWQPHGKGSVVENELPFFLIQQIHSVCLLKLAVVVHVL